MSNGPRRIAARSRKQAMDWSLALVSQGIEAIIDRDEIENDWGLIVNEGDYSAALETIRQYRLENRRWAWRQPLIQPGILFDWGAFGWMLLIFVFYWADSRSGLKTAGIMNSMEVVQGAWWRLFTAVWLHADLGHLAGNATSGLLLLGLAMGRYGTGTGLSAAYLAGAFGNVVAWLLAAGPHRSLGASGLVMGSLGLLAAQSIALWPTGSRSARYILSGLVAGLMLFVLVGLGPETDVLAHLGGFVGGIMIGALLSFMPELHAKSLVQVAAGGVFALLVILPWWLALRHAGQM